MVNFALVMDLISKELTTIEFNNDMDKLMRQVYALDRRTLLMHMYVKQPDHDPNKIHHKPKYVEIYVKETEQTEMIEFENAYWLRNYINNTYKDKQVSIRRIYMERPSTINKKQIRSRHNH